MASLDSKFLKVRGKFVSSDLPEIRGFLLCSVSLTLSHNDMLVEGTKNGEKLQGLTGHFFLSRTMLNCIWMYLDSSSPRLKLGFLQITELDRQADMVHLVKSGPNSEGGRHSRDDQANVSAGKTACLYLPALQCSLGQKL